MEKIDDKIIFTNITEIVDPSHTALVIWDIQNMLLKRIFNDKEQFTNALNSIINTAKTVNVNEW